MHTFEMNTTIMKHEVHENRSHRFEPVLNGHLDVASVIRLEIEEVDGERSP